MNRQTISYSFRATLPVCAGYVVLGIGFGILLSEILPGVGWSALMSAAIYAGSMQFAALGLIGSGAGFASVAVMTIMVNIRHLFYGISMLERYSKVGPEKPYLIFSLTDETFSLVCSPDLPENVSLRGYYLLVSLFDHFYWIAGSVLGSVFGGVLADGLPGFSTEGLDFAMTALFTVILVSQWESAENHYPAIAGAAVSVICLLIFGPDSFLIPAMIGICLSLIPPMLKGEKEGAGK